jgi:hypothetical protein
LPSGKRYCAAHKEEYRRRRRLHEQISATLPDCALDLAPDCTGKLSKTRFDAGDTSCLQCQREDQVQQDLLAEYTRKMTMFDDADTVHELKLWMREFVL